DEAHRLGGSTDQVARFKLGQGLSEAAPYFLLLSATPHQGKTDAFHRLLSLIDAQAFPDVGSVTQDRVQPYVIRTEKRRAITAEGKPLFKPRKTELVPVSWGEAHQDQRLLYEAVTEYVREGYNQAMREKRSYIGFLMILMQRLVVSSTSAIRTTLERRLEVLEAPQEQLTLFPMYSDDDWADLDGQEQIETLLTTRLKALKNERAEVKLLLEAATRCEQAGPDAKAEALLDWLYRLQADEGDPELKVLVFTEFVPTQQMLQQFLTERGFPVVCLNGSMDMDERKKVQDAFAEDLSACNAQAGARILISTDAGGEGLNLQFCHVVINYDIPWNPMRLEQRIGRVDRIGQTHVVRAVNFVFEDSVEHRVREVLEEKLAVIFEEFGIDKTGDVLDSAQAGQIFDDLYVEAILNPDDVDTSVDKVITRLQEQVRDTQASSSVLGANEELEPSEAQRLMAHPLPHWIETMTTSWLRSRSDELKVMSTEHVEKRPRAEAIGKNGPATIWRLVWPDGFVQEGSFTHHSLLSPHHSKLGLEEPRIRGLAMRLPRFAPGQPISIVTIPGISDEITGLWSLWRISIAIEQNQLGTLNPELGTRRRRIMPLFVGDGGKIFTPTARHLWDQLLSATPNVQGHLDMDESREAFDRLAEIAEEHGKFIYDELVQEHRSRLIREKEKGEYAFAARRKIIERVGLPQVRDHRLDLLQQEELAWRDELERKARVYPEMVPLLVIRVEENH
ncbi:helicase, partial [Thermococci archaeon]